MASPTALHIGGLALILGILTFAQRLGAWESKHLARIAVLVAYAFGIAWLFVFVPERAAWICTVLVVFVATWPTKKWFQEYRASRKNQGLVLLDAATIPVGEEVPYLEVTYDKGYDPAKGANPANPNLPASPLTESLVFKGDHLKLNSVGPLTVTTTLGITVQGALEWVEKGSFQRHEIVSHDVNDSNCSVRNLVKPGRYTDYSVTVFYETARQQLFSRRFALTRRGDSLEWKPDGPPRPHDPTQR